MAKRDLAPGEILDQIGEYTYRAWTMEASRARMERAHPVGLLTGGEVIGSIRRGELITSDNVVLPDSSRIVELRRRQDQALYGDETRDI